MVLATILGTLCVAFAIIAGRVILEDTEDDSIWKD